jgi:hypothetical protein
LNKTGDSGQFNRRRFIGILTGISISAAVIPTAYFAFFSKRKKDISPSSRSLINGHFKFFTPYQATVIDEVTSLIIPTDQDPGAREAGMVFKLDHIIARSRNLKMQYVKGIEWLDYMAEKTSDKESFLDLTQDEKIKVLRIADSGRASLTHKVYLLIRYRDTISARKFFRMIRRQTFEVFYTSEMGWKVAGYEGPPQWAGHIDYHKCP